MVRQARAMVADGTLGAIRLVQVEYAQDWLTRDPGNKQADWRTDPARSGAGGATGDIGTHAFNLASFVTGLELEAARRRPQRLRPGRRLDDNAQVLMRFKGGRPRHLWASQVAPGNENALRLRVYGDEGRPRMGAGGAEPPLAHPLRRAEAPHHPRRRRRPEAAAAVTRIPSGHPEGYLEGFATSTREIARAIRAGAAPGADASCRASRTALSGSPSSRPACARPGQRGLDGARAR
jgi:predicted dehydrogenase